MLLFVPGNGTASRGVYWWCDFFQCLLVVAAAKMLLASCSVPGKKKPELPSIVPVMALLTALLARYHFFPASLDYCK